jgi:nicotinate-nucleotide--dimethylbenzimidazole phosphoribosyltransferase
MAGQLDDSFPEHERSVVYRTLEARRDIRHFVPYDLKEDMLQRLLQAAHAAPSVGFMQPWDFIIIRDLATRTKIRDHVRQEKEKAGRHYENEDADLYQRLKIEGIMECSALLAVTCNPERGGNKNLGRVTMPQTAQFSVCAAVQNLWLAARAEGLGVGWVSILEPAWLKNLLCIPEPIDLIALLCVGKAEHFPKDPLLQTAGWRSRESLEKLTHYECWRTPMTSLHDLLSRIEPLDQPLMDEAQKRLDSLTKPVGSLGRLEELAQWLVGVTRQDRPSLSRKVVFTFAADHGVTQEGVSAFPAAVTPEMVRNFLRGGAAINVLARRAGADVVIADFGVAADFGELPGLIARKIGRGTANMAKGPAMTEADAIKAILAGAELALAEKERGAALFATGDMGIGNTTAASALVAALTGAPVEEVTGRGTGIDDEGFRRKVNVIRQALEVNGLNAITPVRTGVQSDVLVRQTSGGDALSVLAKVGGFEIAGLVGVILAGAATRTPVLVDGFISGAAALVACRLAKPKPVRDYLAIAHLSVEKGHQRIARELALVPLLDFRMRLGEGTGAALAMPLLDAACAIYSDMATFAEAGVSGKNESVEPKAL